MTTTTPPRSLPRRLSGGGVRALYSGNASAVVERGLRATRSGNWVIVLSGFF